MCGRYTLHAPPDEIARVFELPPHQVRRIFDLGPRYNIAPTSEVAAVRTRPDGEAREPVLLRWGLIPHWARDKDIGARMINARSETVSQKPAFRDAFGDRRCLVIADGFYEWQKLPNRKQPHYIRLTSGEPFAFAGLWDRWEGPGPSVIESCAIITTRANSLTKTVHDRMPVILDREDRERWLELRAEDAHGAESLLALLRPFPESGMTVFPVSTVVNSPGNDVPECIEPVGPPVRLQA